MITREEQLVCAIIRGDSTSWPGVDDCDLDRLVEAVFRHSVHLIVFDVIERSPTRDGWPKSLHEILKQSAIEASAVDLIRERELRNVLSALNACGIQPLLLKGVPLAYTLYRSPTLRPRSDTDLWVRPENLKTVAHVLTEMGYEGPDIEVENLTSYQCAYSRKTLFGVDHTLDLHWKINNAQLFARMFAFDEIVADAVEIPSLAPCALGPSHKHALLLACVHRFGHAHAPFYSDGSATYAGDHLRWVYDIHLLCSAFNSSLWTEFANLAITKCVAAFCVDGLTSARDAFHTEIPGEAMGALQAAASSEGVDPGRLKASSIAWFWANLRALPDRWEQLVLIKQVALPPAAYMMKKYKSNNWLMLPLFYGFRSVNGVFKRVRRCNSRQ